MAMLTNGTSLPTARPAGARPRAPAPSPQLVVPRGWWQSAQPAAGEAGYSFLSCIVAPAFDFEAFVIAEPGWEPGQASAQKHGGR